VILKAMAKKPADRFQSMGEFIKALEKIHRAHVGIKKEVIARTEEPTPVISSSLEASPVPLNQNQNNPLNDERETWVDREDGNRWSKEKASASKDLLSTAASRSRRSIMLVSCGIVFCLATTVILGISFPVFAAIIPNLNIPNIFRAGAATNTNTPTVQMDNPTPSVPPSMTPSPTPSVTLSLTLSPTLSMIPSLTPTVTKTNVPGLTFPSSKDCLADYFLGIAGAISDPEKGGVYVLEVKANEPFTASFSVRNIGTCTWDPSFNLVFIKGEQMGAQKSVLLETFVQPNTNIIIKVGPIVDSSNGYHYSYWIMQSSDGREFGQELVLRVHILG
jgi:hypothetical protein